MASLMIGVVAPPARAAPADNAAISLDRSQVQPGQRVSVTMSGWRARSVNISVCGNLARRGSADCNVAASQEAGLVNWPEATSISLVVFAPPATCPCVVRVASADQAEVVVAPIELAGVALGPVVGPVFDATIQVSISARPEVKGIVAAVRSTLGGPTAYRATVNVRNVSSETIANVALAGSAGRSGADTAVSFDFPPTGAMAPGATWRHELRVRLPAPLLSRATWRVIASGAGAPAEARTVTHRAPVGFIFLAIAFVADVVAMLWYFSARRLARRRPADAGAEQDTAPESVSVRYPAAVV